MYLLEYKNNISTDRCHYSLPFSYFKLENSYIQWKNVFIRRDASVQFEANISKTTLKISLVRKNQLSTVSYWTKRRALWLTAKWKISAPLFPAAMQMVWAKKCLELADTIMSIES